jgi:hypothetical protein
MTPVWLLTLSIGLVSLTSLGLLIIRDWRWSILTLSIQYIGVVLMVMPAWPLELAMTKLIAGWMAGAILGVSLANSPLASGLPRETQTSLSGQIFRLIAAGLVALVLFSIVPRSTDWFVQVNIASRWGGFILIGMGLLHLGLTNHPLRVTLGLLTVFSGFEILYASVESSTLVAGLIAGITLGLALVCAYLLIAPTIEEGE